MPLTTLSPPLNCIHILMKMLRSKYFGIAFIQDMVVLYIDVLRMYFFLGITQLSESDLRWFKGDLT